MLKLRYLLLLGLLLFCPRTAHAACSGSSPTWTAASAAATDVQACASETLHCGDTIIVPTGAATWGAGAVTVTAPTGCSANQGITLEGSTSCSGGCAPGSAGVSLAFTGNTSTTCTSASATCITISGNEGLLMTGCSNTSFCRVTGFTFIAGAGGSPTAGLVQINGSHSTLASFRADHFHIINTAQNGVFMLVNNLWGLIDHRLDDDTASTAETPLNTIGDYPTRGYSIWQGSFSPGSVQAVIVEDSVDNITNPNTAEQLFDGYAGCSYVYRYSIANGSGLGGGHGTDSGQYRGCIDHEYYNDTITNNTASQCIYNIRSGTTIFENNTVSGSDWSCGGAGQGITLNLYRVSQQISVECGTWGCAGIGGIDWTPLSTTNTADHAYMVTANAPDWQPSHSYTAGAVIGPLANNAGYGAGFPCDGTCGGWNYQAEGNCTSGSSEPNPWNQTVGGTQSDGTCTWVNAGGGTEASPGAPSVPAGFLSSAPDATCSSGGSCAYFMDGLGTPGGYPYRDQPGRIAGQVLSPAYACNNTLPSELTASALMNGDSTPVQSGRDYYNNTCSGYTPYTYPDPLQLQNTTPTAPSALMFAYQELAASGSHK